MLGLIYVCTSPTKLPEVMSTSDHRPIFIWLLHFEASSNKVYGELQGALWGHQWGHPSQDPSQFSTCFSKLPKWALVRSTREGNFFSLLVHQGGGYPSLWTKVFLGVPPVSGPRSLPLVPQYRGAPRQDMGAPLNRIDVPPSKQDRGTPWGKVAPQAARFLRFYAGRLSCWHFRTD